MAPGSNRSASLYHLTNSPEKLYDVNLLATSCKYSGEHFGFEVVRPDDSMAAGDA
jgi:hypothetical protein